MRGPGVAAPGLCAWLLGALLPAAELAASPLGDAVGLYKARHYAEAEALLLPLASAEPADPSACYYLAMALQRLGGDKALDSARTWLGKAVARAPDNEVYVAEYAGVCFLLADRDSSYSMAQEGRDSMVRAVELDPGDLEAREGLMKFYAQAPWPLGDADKAFAEAMEIAKRDPKRGAEAYRAMASIFEKAGRADRAQSATAAAQSLARAGSR